MTDPTTFGAIRALDDGTEGGPPLAWASAPPGAAGDWTDSLGARAVLVAALLGLVCACGSGGGPASAKSADDSEPTATRSDDSGDSDAESEPDASEATESAAPRASCDDGQCFRCGEGLCLKGWYCDEGAKGGAACSWLPECASKGGCGCVTRALGDGCSCKEEDGAPHVTCR